MTCPVAHDLDPLAMGFLDDPFPVLARWREEAPVVYVPAIDRWMVTRYADVERILTDPATFSATETQQPVHPMCPEAAAILATAPLVPTMSNCDPPEHQRFRSVMSRAMSPRRMAALRPAIHARANELVDRFAGTGRVDIVRALFYPLPALTIFDLIGFPAADSDRIKTWCAGKLEVNWGHPEPARQVELARKMVEFVDYCAGFVADRRRAPADDLTSALVTDERVLSDAEITSLIFALSFAGHETTTNLLGNMLRHLLASGAWQEIGDDRALIPGAVEETLRFDSSVPMWRRVTTRAVEIGGVALPAGSRLVLAFAAADREPTMFPEPDRFDIRRPNARRQLSFGRGIHLCLGAGLARMECEIVTDLLADRLPGLRLAADTPVEFSPNLSFRGPLELLVEWDAPAPTEA
ncbi:cytochrome P450 [Pseudonocardia sp. TRM90224]|uniref:cytochrome P450 n=1 Tax=Pseudonocardia sp. TRM90224 TaxID=2812678 RepID=UPI001E31218F|nr:cytochrome P450 [Pseudonocardia sp. TRM90224]